MRKSVQYILYNLFYSANQVWHTHCSVFIMLYVLHWYMTQVIFILWLTNEVILEVNEAHWISPVSASTAIETPGLQTET
jgi:hypothetical protein